MSNTDVVRAGMAAWSSADWATLSALITDDFMFSGPTPQPLDKNAFLGLGRALLIAFPDWNFNAEEAREEGDTVRVTVHVTGTQTGTLAAIPGAPTVAPTGKQVALPADHLTYTIRDGKASKLDVASEPGGGVAGLYSAVGAPLG